MQFSHRLPKLSTSRKPSPACLAENIHRHLVNLPAAPEHDTSLPFKESTSHRTLSPGDIGEALKKPRNLSKVLPYLHAYPAPPSTEWAVAAHISIESVASSRTLDPVRDPMTRSQPQDTFPSSTPVDPALSDGTRKEKALPDLPAKVRVDATDLDPEEAPPLDAISARAHWWGFELLIPHSQMDHVAGVVSNTQTFLMIMDKIADRVPVMKPFIGPLSAYLTWQWRIVARSDQGQGVILSAIWLVPALFVPRPWDVPQKDKIPKSIGPTEAVFGTASLMLDAPSPLPKNMELKKGWRRIGRGRGGGKEVAKESPSVTRPLSSGRRWLPQLTTTPRRKDVDPSSRLG
ncbi:MAG: hypothetical protein DHS80DRAFT_32086 [Piptocephalis tieghemiana]|nr:MAG: hypothetical protein DHS80DRAFT_32086 [Piptocephalis tieghemiana]